MLRLWIGCDLRTRSRHSYRAVSGDFAVLCFSSPLLCVECIAGMATKRIIQVIFVIVNCIFLLAGILLIAAGGFALGGHLDELIPIPNFNAIAGIIIFVGLLVLGISLFGLIGGVKRNNILLRIVRFHCVPSLVF